MAGWQMALALLYLWPQIAFVASSVLSVAHAAEELRGEGAPLGDYMARLWGLPRLRRPLDAGVLILPLILGLLAANGYLGGHAAALIALCAWRWIDCLCMHWLAALVRRPNPGFWTSLVCGLEALALTWWLAGGRV